MNRILSFFTVILLPIALVLTLAIAPTNAALLHFSGTRPTTLGVQKGKLAPCPSTPNCVSSQADDIAHQIQPIAASSLVKIKAAIGQISEIIEASEIWPIAALILTKLEAAIGWI